MAGFVFEFASGTEFGKTEFEADAELVKSSGEAADVLVASPEPQSVGEQDLALSEGHCKVPLGGFVRWYPAGCFGVVFGSRSVQAFGDVLGVAHTKPPCGDTHRGGPEGLGGAIAVKPELLQTFEDVQCFAESMAEGQDALVVKWVDFAVAVMKSGGKADVDLQPEDPGHELRTRL